MAFDVGIENRTPFSAGTFVLPDAEGQEVLVLVISASFESGSKAELQPAQEQLGVTPGDVPFGDPALSSTRLESDIAPLKPACEVIVNATAYAPGGRPVREMQVGLKVGALRKVLAVTGDRLRDAAGFSQPHPFTTMPMTYERAFGGTLEDGQADMRNPVGVGFKGAQSADPTVRTQAPNLAYPGETDEAAADRLRPAGFGSIGRGWLPRLKLAGTYDQAWLDQQWPLPPKDFDARYHLSAPEDQRLASLDGSDVTLIGMTREGRWDFRLPQITAPIHLLFDDRVEQRRFAPDTLLIEPDLRRVTMKARLSFVTRRNGPTLREIAFGHLTPAWLSARRKGKAYQNLRGGDGTLADKQVWQP